MAKSIARVLERHAMAAAADCPLPFGVFVTEVQDEILRAHERQAAKDLQRTRDVAGMTAALASVEAAAPAGGHRFVDLDPAALVLALTAAGPSRPDRDPAGN